MIYSNSEDHKKEVAVLKKLAGKIPELAGFTFRRNTEPLAIYDFGGRKGIREACFDVKVRDIMPDAYNNYFISEEKVNHMNEHEAEHFIAYRFINGVIRVFNLNLCLMNKRNLTFENKRAGEMQTKTVYELPVHLLSYEFYDLS